MILGKGKGLRKSYSLENGLLESIFREDLFLYNWLQLAIDSESGSGVTPLHEAVASNYLHLVAAILDYVAKHQGASDTQATFVQ